MHNLTIIWRSKPASIARELAEQIYETSFNGYVVVLTDKPAGLMAATRKQWAREIRRLQRERASTLNAHKIKDATQRIAWMQSLSFTCKAPGQVLVARVTFATVDNLLLIPPICQTLLVADRVEREKLHLLSSWMPKDAKVIIYE